MTSMVRGVGALLVLSWTLASCGGEDGLDPRDSEPSGAGEVQPDPAFTSEPMTEPRSRKGLSLACPSTAPVTCPNGCCPVNTVCAGDGCCPSRSPTNCGDGTCAASRQACGGSAGSSGGSGGSAGGTSGGGNSCTSGNPGCTSSYQGPSSNIQRDAQCQAAWSGICAGRTSSQIASFCGIYNSSSWGSPGNCPYCCAGGSTSGSSSSSSSSSSKKSSSPCASAAGGRSTSADMGLISLSLGALIVWRRRRRRP